MFCIKCGAQCADGTRFCEKCGSPLIPPAPPPQASLAKGPYQDMADDPFEEIVANVQKEQVVPPPAPISQPIPQFAPPPPYRPVPPPAPVRKKTGGAIAVVVAVLLLLAAAGGGAFFIFQSRADNERELEGNLAQYMREYCLPDIEDYYDGVLPGTFSADGYTIGQRESSFRMQLTKEADTFGVSGRFDVADKNGATYRVNVEGTVTTNFMRSKYIWDLDYDFEDPPVIADEPVTLPAVSPEPGAWGDMPTDPPEYYLWPTDTQYITYNDLYTYSRYEIMLMRNELYARYGCSFRDEEIRNYFLEQSWYTPNPNLMAVDFSIELFTDIERANLDTILNYERDMGWRQ